MIDTARELAKDKRCKYIVLFKNHGPQSGGSLPHAHSQVVGLPFVPDQILTRLERAKRYYDSTATCLYCRMLQEEFLDLEGDGSRVVVSTESFTLFIPFAASSTYHMYLMPNKHQANFLALSEEPRLITELAKVLRLGIQALHVAADGPSWNFIIRTVPNQVPAGLQGADVYFHWHLEILPRLWHEAGLELGSGLHTNWTLPEAAAATLRETIATLPAHC